MNAAGWVVLALLGMAGLFTLIAVWHVVIAIIYDRAISIFLTISPNEPVGESMDKFDHGDRLMRLAKRLAPWLREEASNE